MWKTQWANEKNFIYKERKDTIHRILVLYKSKTSFKSNNHVEYIYDPKEYIIDGKSIKNGPKMKIIFFGITLSLERQANVILCLSEKQVVSKRQPTALNGTQAPYFESKISFFFLNGIRVPNWCSKYFNVQL